jgi:hypothetical protein
LKRDKKETAREIPAQEQLRVNNNKVSIKKIARMINAKFLPENKDLIIQIKYK